MGLLLLFVFVRF
ncbi:hypothetical protein BpHYR1_049787 [Brachionus plicatilis]|uniref:Uncharacterized protein n=1 Tax=Brachionus plicatilis TaxID=10195 RepID=A0A3M7PHM8_BRAPC|nr:hypothetical protein BpHYR1_049787 [Brachionus plicatilis]